MVSGVAEGNQAKYEEYDDKLGFYTPILKGYIKEHGMEHIARDARIATLYEGTTGIQALDLLGRKVLLQSRGKCIQAFTGDMIALAKPHLLDGGVIGKLARASFKRALQWKWLTLRIMLRAAK